MGFRIEEDTIKADLFISVDEFDKAFKLAKTHTLNQEDYCRVERKEVEDSANLEEYINAMGWDMRTNDNGDLISVYNHGINVADEELLFESIAPLMKDGSYVEFEREGYDGDQKERYDFSNRTVTQTKFAERFDMNDKAFWQEL